MDLIEITSLTLGILGFAAGHIYYRLGRRDKKPSWSIENRNLITGFSKQLPNLEIKYAGQDIENLSVGKIVFWNAGSESIRREDIADSDPLSIVPLNNSTLVDVKLLHQNSQPCGFVISTKPDMTAAFIEFDFIDKNEGAVVQVIHTGTSTTDLCLKGRIKGGGTPKHIPLNHSSIPGMIIYCGTIAGIFLVGWAVTQLVLQNWILKLIIFLLLFISGVGIAIYLAKKVESWIERIPENLRSHFSIAVF